MADPPVTGAPAQAGSRARGRAGLPARLWADRSFRALLLLLALALPLLLHAGRRQWFYLDEWDFLLRRDLGSPGSLLVGWFGHNVLLPAVAYRLVVAVLGTSSYVPFQLLAIAGHVAVVLAVWAVSRRLGARGWIAVAVVAPLVVLGAGRVNILFGFQITMTVALALSLLHLLLADRDGPWSRRDTAGVLCGAVGLLCSGVAVAGAVGVGVAVLLRRGPALAAAHTVPLGIAWSAWYLLSPDRGLESKTTLDRGTIRFVSELPKAALGGLGGSVAVALGLGALAVVGVASSVLWARRAESARPWWAGAAPMLGCVTSLVVFALLVAIQRLPGEGHREPTEGRYVYIVVALSIPLLALGVEAIARYRPVLVLVPLALLAAGVPGNVRRLDDPISFFADRNLVLAFANSEQLDTAPSGRITLLRPQGITTVDELRAVADLPGLPGNRDVPLDVQLLADLVLGLRQGPATGGPPDCPLERHARRRLEAGDSIEFGGRLAVTAVDGAVRSAPITFDGAFGRVLTASGPLEVEVDGEALSGVYACAGR